MVGEPEMICAKMAHIIQVMGGREEKDRKGKTLGGFLSSDFSMMAMSYEAYLSGPKA